MPRRKGLTFIVAVAVISVLSAAVILEFSVRVRQWIKYGTPGAIQEFSQHDESGLRIPTPNKSIGRIRVNSLGFRSPELMVPKAEESIRIAFLGGSTTWCAEVSGNETTWPYLVWKRLQNAYPGVKIEFINAGVPGYSTAESLANLEHRVKPLKPDVIVIYHATNDLSYDTRVLAKTQGIEEINVVTTSWPGKWSLAWYLVEKNTQIILRQAWASSRRSQLTVDAKTLAIPFRERLYKLVKASEEIADLVALATFSYKFRRTQTREAQIKAAVTSQYYMPYMGIEGLLDAFEEYNQVIREAAREMDAILIDKASDIPGDDTHFHDSVHFTDSGSRLMAAYVAEALIVDRRFKALLESKSAVGR